MKIVIQLIGVAAFLYVVGCIIHAMFSDKRSDYRGRDTKGDLGP